MTAGRAAGGTRSVPHPVLAEVVRSGFVEGRHCGSAVVLAPDGQVVLSLGEPDAPTFPRSAAKPIQAVGMLRAGLDLEGDLLAVAAASHSGEDGHLALVRRILTRARLDKTSLQNTPSLPLDPQAQVAWLRVGRHPERITQNCSGKHAAMLAVCVARGWPLETYREPEHPLQMVLRQTMEDMTGGPVAAVAVDGCGAPLFAVSLTGLARAFARLVASPEGTPERRVADAMRAHPWVVGGSGRDVTRLMSGVPGLLAKDGAEAVYAAALPDGTAVAVKVDDGGDRARAPVLVGLLRRLGVDGPVLDDLATSPVLGGGLPVGAVQPVLPALGAALEPDTRAARSLTGA